MTGFIQYAFCVAVLYCVVDTVVYAASCLFGVRL